MVDGEVRPSPEKLGKVLEQALADLGLSLDGGPAADGPPPTSGEWRAPPPLASAAAASNSATQGGAANNASSPEDGEVESKEVSDAEEVADDKAWLRGRGLRARRSNSLKSMPVWLKQNSVTWLAAAPMPSNLRGPPPVGSYRQQFLPRGQKTDGCLGSTKASSKVTWWSSGKCFANKCFADTEVCLQDEKGHPRTDDAR